MDINIFFNNGHLVTVIYSTDKKMSYREIKLFLIKNGY